MRTSNSNPELLYAANHLREAVYTLSYGRYKPISEKAGINRKTIINFVSGYTSITIDRLEAYLNAFGYTLDVKAIEGGQKDVSRFLTSLSDKCGCYKKCPYIHSDFDGDFWCREECMEEDAERITWNG